MAKIINNYSPNFNFTKRSKNKIKFIILHYTGMRREYSAIKRLCNTKSKVSAHYFIKRNGQIINLVPDLYEAWHAGKSSWKNFKSLNKYSIGIEIQNQGHSLKYEKFSKKQIISLKKLLKILIEKYKVNLENILGHSDIAPERKKDPGEKFPWKKIANSNLAFWHKLSEKKIQKYRLKKLSKLEEKNLLKNLYSLGYNKIKNLDYKINNKFLLLAFQRKYRQGLINGKPDHECLMISKNLVKS